MNILKREKQEIVIKCLIDGNSIRSTERITGVHKDSIMHPLAVSIDMRLPLG